MEVISQRICGGCTACCKTHAVLETKKPAGKWCKDCDIGKGCRIYPNHPNACQKFKCEWLKGFKEEAHRPDRIKIVMEYYTGGKIPKLFILWEVSEGSIRGNFAKKMVSFALENDISVCLIYLSGEKKLLPGNVKLTEEIIASAIKQGIRII